MKPAVVSVSPAQAGKRTLGAVVAVFLIALGPGNPWWDGLWLTVLAILTWKTRPPLGTMVRRLTVVWLLAGLVAMGWVGQPGWPSRSANLLLKSTLSLWIISLLVHSMSLPDMVAGLRWLGVPRLWAEPFAFWGRYSSVVAEEWHRLQLARRARTFDQSRWLKFKALANGLGVLFIRAYERAEQVHHAMLARGYRGNDER